MEVQLRFTVFSTEYAVPLRDCDKWDTVRKRCQKKENRGFKEVTSRRGLVGNSPPICDLGKLLKP